MRRKDTFLLIGLLAAASAFSYLLARPGPPLQERQSSGSSSQTTGGPSANQNSMQQMMGSMMSGVVPAGIKPAGLPAPSSDGAKLVARYCAQCHNLPSPLMHSAKEWPGIADRMFSRMSMCSRMSGMGMMRKRGGMGIGGMMGGTGGRGMMGMMNIKTPSAEEQRIIIQYLQKHSLKSIEPDALPMARTKGAVLFASTCAQCHALPDPKQHLAVDWPQIVARMRKNIIAMGKTVPSTETLRTVTEFLQQAARAKR
jgi:mono/diheme cytochrome c family protein